MRPTTLALCGLFCIVTPRVALAQAAPAAQAHEALTVAGLRAPDGDSDLASSLSDALRESARTAGYEVPANTPALDQEFAMIGCADATPECLGPIADDLHAPRFLFGSVQRVGRGRDAQLTVELNLWDNVAHRTSSPATVTATRAQLSASPDAVRVLARRLLDDVLHGAQPAAAAQPDAEAERRRAEEERARLEAARLLRQTPPSRSRTRLWVGVGLLGAGVVMGGLAAWQWGVSSGLRDDSTNARGQYGLGWARYDDSINRPVNGVYALSVDDVCARAASDAARNPDAAQANSLCEATSTSKTLAWVFGLGGIALAGVGATLVVLDTMSGRSANEGTTRPAQARLELAPVFGTRVNGLDLRLTF
jgi:hypothetical protein